VFRRRLFFFSFEQGTIVEWMAQIGQRVEEEVRKHRSHQWERTFSFFSLLAFVHVYNTQHDDLNNLLLHVRRTPFRML
jgi:hypothetical protein